MAITETVFWVLTALGAGPRHGYAVLREAERVSDGAVRLRVTTLYATLDRLQRAGLVQPAGEEIVDGRARRYFELTSAGRAELEQETAHLEARARAAHRALAGGGAAAPALRVRLAR